MQFWPRKQTKRTHARIRCWADVKEPRLLGFAGYKTGMTHVLITDNRKTSLTKGEDIFCPVTVIECPPVKAASIVFYKKDKDGSRICSEVFAENIDKELERRALLPKNIKKRADDIKDFDDIRLKVYTQPKLTGIGKKIPDLFEVAIGGSKEDKLNYAKNILGKEIRIEDVFKEGQQVDIHSVTKGKGTQGPVKRFGVSLRSHKSEKTKRGPGSLGAWCGQAHMMYRVAHAGRMGYYQRAEYNKLILRIGKNADGINVKGGFPHYGLVKNNYILVKGSVGGSAKRMIKMSCGIRQSNKMPQEAPPISYVSMESKQ